MAFPEDASSDKMRETGNEKKNDISFPGIYDFYVSNVFGMNIVDAQIQPSFYNSTGGIYGSMELYGGIKIPASFYSVKIMSKDRILIAGKGSKLIWGKNETNYMRNRFVCELDNYFSIPKIMNIGLNTEMRLQSFAYFTDSTDASYTFSPLEIRLSPQLDLNGTYDCGFSWGVKQTLRFYFYPGKSEQDEQYSKFQYVHSASDMSSCTLQIYPI